MESRAKARLAARRLLAYIPDMVGALSRNALRRLRVAFLLAVIVPVVGFAATKAYDLLVVQPRLAEEAFQIIRTDVPAPDPPLVGAEGKRFLLSGLRGQVVFVNFWATWCPPCLEEMPSMVQLGRDLAEAHPGKFRMVAVSGDQGWTDVDQYLRRTFGGVPRELTFALDPGGEVARAYYCAARRACPEIKFPETYIIDRSGRVVAYFVNGRDWTEPVARRFLERLIGG